MKRRINHPYRKRNKHIAENLQEKDLPLCGTNKLFDHMTTAPTPKLGMGSLCTSLQFQLAAWKR